MTAPQVKDTYYEGRRGVLAFAKIVNDIRCLWRETPNADVGIDGQVEYVDELGNCTGKAVAVQVKSGSSYVKQGDERSIVLYPEEKHREYWRRFPIPVMLVIYDPSRDVVCWTDARRYLRSPETSQQKGIIVPRAQILTLGTRSDFFAGTGPVDGDVLSPELCLRELARRQASESNVTFLELFGFGLVDIGDKLFFSAGFFLDIADAKSVATGSAAPSVPYDFLEEYIRFLVEQDLIHYDYCQFVRVHPSATIAGGNGGSWPVCR